MFIFIVYSVLKKKKKSWCRIIIDAVMISVFLVQYLVN